MSCCPSREQFALLLAEKLTDPEAGAVEAHVQGCFSCQEALEELSRPPSTERPGPDAGEWPTLTEEPSPDFLHRLREAVPAAAWSAELAAQSLKRSELRISSSALPTPRAEACPQVAGYEVLDELGRGGMGLVYRARQVRLDRVVALKVLLAGAHANAQERARFRAEAEAVARLQHPNIVQIYEVGEEEGRPYLALEYVEGGSLADKLRGTPLPARQAAELADTLARAVHAAHLRGVVHRDLKPANVLLTADGTPKVVDFGLAKRLDGVTLHTQTGAVLGTPDFMAPEQAEGKGVGPAADVHALGALLYQMLTGRPPFLAANALDTLLRVRLEEPVPPSVLQPRTPRDLATICLKCLRKEPHKRYASALALADDLRRFLNGEPIQARPVSRGERLWRWCQRNPWLAGLSASVLALLVVLAVGATGAAIWLDRERNDAVASQKRAEAAERDKTEKLWQSYLDRARAGRFSRLRGQRFDSLEAVRAAAAIRYDLQLRNEAIACLALADLRPAPPGTPFARPPRVLTAAFGQASALDPTRWQRATAEGNVVVVRSPGREVPLRLTHPAPVDSVLWSGDGRLLAVACYNRKVYVRRLPTGQLLSVLEGLAGLVRLEFSPSGRFLLTLGYDGMAHLWDPVGGQLLVQSRDPVVGPFSADDDLLENHGRLWQVADGGECRILNPIEEGGDAAASDRMPTWNAQFSPDGRLLATAPERSVILWDAAKGNELVRLPATPVRGGIHFLNDGSLCTADQSGLLRWSIRLRDGTDGTLQVGPPRTLLTLPLVPARQHATSRDGRWLAVAESQGNRALLLDPEHPANVRPLPGQLNCHYAAVSPDGRWAATASWAFDPPVPIKIWDTATAACVHQITEGSYATVTFTPDGRWLVAGGQTAYQFWEVGTWRRGRRFTRTSNLPGPAAFSPDGRLMAMVPSNFVVRLVGPETGDEIATLTPPNPGLVSALCFSGDGSRLAVATENNPVFVWDLRAIRRGLREMELDWDLPDYPAEAKGSDRPVVNVLGGQAVGPGAGGADSERKRQQQSLLDGPPLTGHTDIVTCVSYRPDGRLLATGSYDHTVRLWDLTTRQVMRTLEGHTQAVWGLAWSPDGKRLASASGNPSRRDTAAEIKLWDTETGKELRTLPSPGGGVYGLAWSPDGKRLASAGFDKVVRLWDPDSGKEIRTLPGHTKELWGVAFSHDGQRLASTGFDATVRVWDVATGKPVLTASGHEGPVWSVAYSPDGKLLATAGDDWKVRLWDAATGTQLRQLSGHSLSPYSVCFSRDGKRLLSASGHRWQPGHAGEVIAWDVATGKELDCLIGDSYGFFAAAFAPDGRHFACAAMDRSVKLCDLEKAETLPGVLGKEAPP
jgi:WD40 repeat protein